MLDRVTGIANVPEYIPRRIGEILRPPVLVGAALGGVLSLLWLRARGRCLGAIVGVVAVVVFAAFATVGLPINTRYAFLAAAILCVFCGAGVFGWTQPGRAAIRGGAGGWPAGCSCSWRWSPTRRASTSSAHRELDELAHQQRIEGDLVALVRDHAIRLQCGPVGVPNHAPIPLLSLYLKTSPAERHQRPGQPDRIRHVRRPGEQGSRTRLRARPPRPAPARERAPGLRRVGDQPLVADLQALFVTSSAESIG